MIGPTVTSEFFLLDPQCSPQCSFEVHGETKSHCFPWGHSLSVWCPEGKPTTANTSQRRMNIARTCKTKTLLQNYNNLTIFRWKRLANLKVCLVAWNNLVRRRRKVTNRVMILKQKKKHCWWTIRVQMQKPKQTWITIQTQVKTALSSMDSRDFNIWHGEAVVRRQIVKITSGDVMTRLPLRLSRRSLAFHYGKVPSFTYSLLRQYKPAVYFSF